MWINLESETSKKQKTSVVFCKEYMNTFINLLENGAFTEEEEEIIHLDLKKNMLKAMNWANKNKEKKPDKEFLEIENLIKDGQISLNFDKDSSLKEKYKKMLKEQKFYEEEDEYSEIQDSNYFLKYDLIKVNNLNEDTQIKMFKRFRQTTEGTFQIMQFEIEQILSDLNNGLMSVDSLYKRYSKYVKF